MGEMVIEAWNSEPSLRRLVSSPCQLLRARMVRHILAKTSRRMDPAIEQPRRLAEQFLPAVAGHVLQGRG